MERRLRKFSRFQSADIINSRFGAIGFLEGHVESSGVRIRQATDPEYTTAPSAHELDVLEEATARYEQRIAHLLESKETLERRQAELIEFRHVLRETASFFAV